MKMHWLPTTPPTAAEWETRRSIYDGLWLEQINPKGSTTNQHADSLKLELERCFCAGAWVACISLSAAIIEVHLSHLDALRGKARDDLIEKLNIKEEWDALREKRNNIVHGAGPNGDGKRLTTEKYRKGYEELQYEAEHAVELALRVVLNNPEISSSTSDAYSLAQAERQR